MSLPTIREMSVEIVEEVQIDVGDDNDEVQYQLDESPDHICDQGERQHSLGKNDTHTREFHSSSNHNALLGLELSRPVSSGTDLRDQYAFQPPRQAYISKLVNSERQMQENPATLRSITPVQLPTRGEARQLIGYVAHAEMEQATPHRAQFPSTLRSGQSIHTEEGQQTRNIADRPPRIQPVEHASRDAMFHHTSKPSYGDEVHSRSERANEDSSLHIDYKPLSEIDPVTQNSFGSFDTPDTCIDLHDTDSIERQPAEMQEQRSTKRKFQELLPEQLPSVEKLASPHVNHVDQHPPVLHTEADAGPLQGSAGTELLYTATTDSTGISIDGNNKTARDFGIYRTDKSSTKAQGTKRRTTAQSKPLQTRQKAAIRTPTVTEVFTVLGDTITGNIEAGFTKIAREQQQDINTYCSEMFSLKEENARLNVQLETANRERHEVVEMQKENTAHKKLFQEKATKLQKFVNGLNNDIQRERATNKELSERVEAMTLDSRSLSDKLRQALGHSSTAIDDLSNLRTKTLRELHDTAKRNKELETEQQNLVEQLGAEKNKISELVLDRDRLQLKLDKYIGNDHNMGTLIANNHNTVLEKLSELPSSLGLQEPSLSCQISAIAASIQALHEKVLVEAEPENDFRQALVNFEAKLCSKLQEMCVALDVSANVHAANESAQGLSREELDYIQEKMFEWQDLQHQLSGLREAKTVAGEKLNVQDSWLKDLSEQLNTSKLAESEIRKQNVQLLQQVQAQAQGKCNSINNAHEDSERKRRVPEERENTLHAQIEELKAILASKDHEICASARLIESLKRENDEKLNQLRNELEKNADWALKNERANYENKVRDLHNKNRKLEEALHDVQLERKSTDGRGKVAKSKAIVGQNDRDNNDLEEQENCPPPGIQSPTHGRYTREDRQHLGELRLSPSGDQTHGNNGKEFDPDGTDAMKSFGTSKGKKGPREHVQGDEIDQSLPPKETTATSFPQATTSPSPRTYAVLENALETSNDPPRWITTYRGGELGPIIREETAAFSQGGGIRAAASPITPLPKIISSRQPNPHGNLKSPKTASETDFSGTQKTVQREKRMTTTEAQDAVHKHGARLMLNLQSHHSNKSSEGSHKRHISTLPGTTSASKRSRVEMASSKEGSHQQAETNPFHQHKNLHHQSSGKGQSAEASTGRETPSIESASYQALPVTSRAQSPNSKSAASKPPTAHATHAVKRGRTKIASAVNVFNYAPRRSTRLNN